MSDVDNEKVKLCHEWVLKKTAMLSAWERWAWQSSCKMCVLIVFLYVFPHDMMT